MNKGDTLIHKNSFNKQLPDKYSLEKDVKIGKDANVHSPDRLFAVALVSKNGSRRLAKEDTEKIVNVLENHTDMDWKVDGVSNFVFHLDQEIKEGE